MGGSAGSGPGRNRPGPRGISGREAVGARQDRRRGTAHPPEHAIRQHHPARRGSFVSRRPRHGAADQEPDPLERDGHGGSAEQVRRRNRRPHFHLRLAGHAARSRVQPFLSRQLRRSAGRPDLLSGPRLAGSIRPRLSGRPAQRRSPEEFPPRAARQTGAFLLPAPVADAGLLAVPHRVHGTRADQLHLPGALHAVPGKPRRDPAHRAQGVGVSGRWRDRRAGIHGIAHAGLAREAGQSHLRRELQPAAPGWPGARQRQDHPGTGSGFPWGRLERDQADLGRGLGRSARARHHRSAGQAHGRGGGRRVPDLRHTGRRVHPQELLR